MRSALIRDFVSVATEDVISKDAPIFDKATVLVSKDWKKGACSTSHCQDVSDNRPYCKLQHSPYAANIAQSHIFYYIIMAQDIRPAADQIAYRLYDQSKILSPVKRARCVRCKDLADICCTSRGIAHFVLNFVAMATRIGRGKIQLAAFDGPFSKTPPQMQKISQISITQAKL